MTQLHVGPPLIPLIKEKCDDKSEKNSVKLKLRIDPKLPTSDLYEFKMSLLDNGKPEFFLFVRNSNMTLAASGTLEAGAKHQYLCTLVRVSLNCCLLM